MTGHHIANAVTDLAQPIHRPVELYARDAEQVGDTLQDQLPRQRLPPGQLHWIPSSTGGRAAVNALRGLYRTRAQDMRYNIIHTAVYRAHRGLRDRKGM